MCEKDAAKIVAATAVAGVMFVGLVAFRLVKGVVLLAQLARPRQHRLDARPADKLGPEAK